MSRVVTVIPAAGRGTRLGLDVPKLFAPLGGERTVWTELSARALAVSDHVHVVLSPWAVPFFERAAEALVRSGRASFSVQHEPRGMGDAILAGHEAWRTFDHAIVVWGDQVGVSGHTLRRVADALRASAAATLVLPVVRPAQPYVEYRFDDVGRLARVLQSREGDACRAGGFADVGVFGLTVRGLVDAWRAYEALASSGAVTGEVNFLPFLPYLSTTAGWAVVRIDVDDPDEARGINTAEDLEYFRRKLVAGGPRGGGPERE